MRHHPSNHKNHRTALALVLMLALLTLACALPVSAVQSRMGRTGAAEHRIAQDGQGLIDRGRDIVDDIPVPELQDGDASDDHDGNIANDPNGNTTEDGHTATDDTSNPSHDLSREPLDTTPEKAAGILPWIIGALVLLSIVLVVLALIPKKRQSR